MAWHIDRLVPGGDGFLRLPDGRAAFAAGALPGDVIEPDSIEDRRSYVRATRWTLVEPGPDRVEPPCPVVDACGGCDLMRLSRPAQLRAKAGILREALARTGGFRDLPDPLPMIAVGDDLGYRSRIRVHVDDAGRVGYFARGTHELVEIPGCPIAAPGIDAALGELRARASNGDVPTGDTELGGEPGVFSQVNRAVNERLVADLVAGARERGVTSFCDLYAGAGNFTLPLGAAGLRGVAVERSREAVDAGRRASEAQGLELRFIAGDVAREAKRLDARPELVLLDPPRTGAREVIASVLRLAPRVIAYVACDPVTLARDLRAFANDGYRLESVTGYDMFPHTHHVEALAWLARA